MTEMETDDPGLTLVRVRELRDQLREAGPGGFTTGDLADMLDQVLGEDTRRKEPAVQAVTEALMQMGADYDQAWMFAEQAVAVARPVITLEELADLAELLEQAPLRCPVHDSTECSADSNGCELPTQIPAAYAQFVRSLAENYVAGREAGFADGYAARLAEQDQDQDEDEEMGQ